MKIKYTVADHAARAEHFIEKHSDIPVEVKHHATYSYLYVEGKILAEVDTYQCGKYKPYTRFVYSELTTRRNRFGGSRERTVKKTLRASTRNTNALVTLLAFAKKKFQSIHQERHAEDMRQARALRIRQVYDEIPGLEAKLRTQGVYDSNIIVKAGTGQVLAPVRFTIDVNHIDKVLAFIQTL